MLSPPLILLIAQAVLILALSADSAWRLRPRRKRIAAPARVTRGDRK